MDRLERRLAQDRVVDEVAHGANRPDEDSGVEVSLAAIFPVGRRGVAREIPVVAMVGHEPDAGDQPGHDADRERATAEAESVELVARLIVAAAERVDVDDVALQAETENTSERSKELE